PPPLEGEVARSAGGGGAGASSSARFLHGLAAAPANRLVLQFPRRDSLARRILVVDDDPRLREVVRYALSREGFEIDEAGDGHAAIAACDAKLPDLVVLDV